VLAWLVEEDGLKGIGRKKRERRASHAADIDAGLLEIREDKQGCGGLPLVSQKNSSSSIAS